LKCNSLDNFQQTPASDTANSQTQTQLAHVIQGAVKTATQIFPYINLIYQTIAIGLNISCFSGNEADEWQLCPHFNNKYQPASTYMMQEAPKSFLSIYA